MIYIGLPQWSHPKWVRLGITSLEEYARHFNCVEGNTTLYAHMSSIKTSVGAYVNQGDVIGITGSTGNSTGPHLHFEVTENGVRVNPLSGHGAEPRMGYLTGYTLSASA